MQLQGLVIHTRSRIDKCIFKKCNAQAILEINRRSADFFNFLFFLVLLISDDNSHSDFHSRRIGNLQLFPELFCVLGQFGVDLVVTDFIPLRVRERRQPPRRQTVRGRPAARQLLLPVSVPDRNMKTGAGTNVAHIVAFLPSSGQRQGQSAKFQVIVLIKRGAERVIFLPAQHSGACPQCLIPEFCFLRHVYAAFRTSPALISLNVEFPLS
mmetsp:Transcript_21433/g.38909  ORF Transcript_21433/g.38909 Transcript_21433/m.38909 type:complete len:211 (-) Transcript_21433:114-746(-)